MERIMFFDPAYGIGLNIAAGSGRSWMDEPDGDPRLAHCRVDVPRDVLIATPEPEAGPAHARPSSGMFFVAWDEVLRFADRLAALTEVAGSASLGDERTRLTIHAREDGRLQASTEFTLGHHVKITLRCETWWDWHFAVRDDLAGLADQVRAAVHASRPAPR